MTSYFLINYFLIIIVIKGNAFQKHTIPENLLECYENGVLLLPMTMRVFIEIIRKIEMSPYFLMDMRMFSTTLYHRFCRDGIEKNRDFVILDENVIPYTTTGFQSFKYQLLSNYLIPRAFQYFSNDTLTLQERCTLHFMLSSSVEIWERGDEYLVCSENFKSQNASVLKSSRKKSSCPFEKGVVETKGFGTISLNHIISGIAAALQPLQIHSKQMLDHTNNTITEDNKYIDNRWVSTFSGDLAEVLIIQKPIIKGNYYFGPGGKWSDVRLPINLCLNANNEAVEKELWQFTDAEMMGAIDGMRLAEEAVIWSQSKQIMRLSQLLELYYTDKYSNQLSNFHACKRKSYFDKITNKLNTLVEQVQSFSHIMVNYMPNYLNNKSIINSESETLVNQFNTYVSTLLRNQEKCPQEIHTKMKIKLNVIYDNTWSQYETLTFLLNLAERIDVSYYGSTMTVIAGDIGNVIVKDCKTLGDLFLNWMFYVHDRGNMFLPESLVRLNKLALDEISSEADGGEWFSHITLILAMSTSLSDQEISDSLTITKSIKQLNPDMIFVYVTSIPMAPMYVKLTSVPDSQNDKIIAIHGNSYHQILEELDSLHFNPIAITPLPCINTTINKRNIKVLEYARPGSINFYRIHPQYLCQVSEAIIIKLQNGNYGNLMACVSRNNAGNDEKECQYISLNEDVLFKIRNPCPSRMIYDEHQTWNENCKPIYLRVSPKQSLSLCTENECQTPADVRFEIIVEGLQCSTEKNNICNGKENINFTLLNLLLISALAINILT